MCEARIPVSGFKECDIRGEFGSEITRELAYRLGRALGTLAEDKEVLIGGDFRLTTPVLMEELSRGAVESGSRVCELGLVTTPAYYFARRRLGMRTAVMVTASHSPPSHNGFKPVLGELPITPEELGGLKQMVLEGKFSRGSGEVQHIDISDDYVEFLCERFRGARFPKIVFDTRNGATGWVLRRLLVRLGIEASILFEEPDGRFPNVCPDVSGLNDLELLQARVVEEFASLGAGFDGDGDRVAFVDERGERVSSDNLIAWLASELLRQRSGESVVFDIKLSRAVVETILSSGGDPIPEKSGHTFIKRAMLLNNAVFGGEYSGHLFYRELEGGDDGLFSALLVGSLIGGEGKAFSELLSEVPRYCPSPEIRIRYEGDRSEIVERAKVGARKHGAKLLLIDGVKAEFERGWALVRASVTEPALTFRFEGLTEKDTIEVAERFLEGMGAVKNEVLERLHFH